MQQQIHLPLIVGQHIEVPNVTVTTPVDELRERDPSIPPWIATGNFKLDSGATLVHLSGADFSPDEFESRMPTSYIEITTGNGGTFSTRLGNLNITIGGRTYQNVSAVCGDTVNLLGLSFMRRVVTLIDGRNSIVTITL